MYEVPEYAATALNLLIQNGFEAYFAGGCVRDFIMNIPSRDFDITTNARPYEIKRIFHNFRTVLTGEKHGTITVVIDENAVEITTYRIDRRYTDGRHPDHVEFTESLTEDLKRRDFTINAMAMSIDGKLIDIYGGREDLKNGIIKAVGDPCERFKEDALRIMRSLRFASRFEFDFDEKTFDAALKMRFMLKKISIERIRNEFDGILCGKYAAETLRKSRDIIAVFIPEIAECFDFDQHSPYHKYDVWEHILHAVEACEQRKNIRLAMFFHDISKPECFKMDKNGIGHFKGHAQAGALKAENILRRLKYPRCTVECVKTLIAHHSDKLKNRYELKKLIREIGPDNVLELLNVQRADSMAKQKFCFQRLKISDEQEHCVKNILENHECVDMKELNINGYDLMKLGFKGKEIGTVLERLLDGVMKDEIRNDNSSLINCAKLLKKI